MRLLLLLFPAVALASIEVNLNGKVDFENKYIAGAIIQKGFEVREITGNDRVAFEIQDEDLKSAIERYHGKKPDQVFFTRDTPWGDLYHKHGWYPVDVKIETDTPVDMFEITSEKVVLTRTVYENSHSTTKKTFIQESETTYDTLTSLWQNPKKISANVVEFSLNFEVEKDVKSASHFFAFGSNRKSTAKNVRSQSGSLDLAAGQKVLVQLETKKGALKFQIPYKISLKGHVVANYNNRYKDHFFYGLDINEVLGNKTLTVNQVLSYQFYYGQTLNIINAEDGYTVMKSFEAETGTSGAQKRKASVAAATGKKITRKALKVPFEFTDEDLKSIVEEELKEHNGEESSESDEETSTTKDKQ